MYTHPMIAETVNHLDEIADQRAARAAERRAARAARRRERTHHRREVTNAPSSSWTDRLGSARPRPAPHTSDR
jgi:septal ring factor EnvC (AmiA/AmiB activator)